MNKYYITFGQIHAHSVVTSKGRMTFDKDCVAEIEAESQGEAHTIAMEVFDGKFHQCEPEDKVDDEFMSFFPRGVIKL